MSHLALAWVARNPNTSTVILGASKPEQVLDNLKALEVIPKLTPDVLAKIEEIVGNKPSPWVRVCLRYRSLRLIDIVRCSLTSPSRPMAAWVWIRCRS